MSLSRRTPLARASAPMRRTQLTRTTIARTAPTTRIRPTARRGVRVEVRTEADRRTPTTHPDDPTPQERQRAWDLWTVGGRERVCCVGGPSCYGFADQLHHRRMRSQGGGTEAENLLPVCSACHEVSVHGQPIMARRHGWIVDSQRLPSTVPVARYGSLC